MGILQVHKCLEALRARNASSTVELRDAAVSDDQAGRSKSHNPTEYLSLRSWSKSIQQNLPPSNSGPWHERSGHVVI